MEEYEKITVMEAATDSYLSRDHHVQEALRSCSLKLKAENIVIEKADSEESLGQDSQQSRRSLREDIESREIVLPTASYFRRHQLCSEERYTFRCAHSARQYFRGTGLHND